MDLLHFQQQADFARQSAKKLVGRAHVDVTMLVGRARVDATMLVGRACIDAMMANLESRLMEGCQDKDESWGSAEGYFVFVRSAKLGNCALQKCVPRH